MKTAFRLPFLTIKTGMSPIFCKVKDPSEIPIGLLAWQGQKDSNLGTWFWSGYGKSINGHTTAGFPRR